MLQHRHRHRTYLLRSQEEWSRPSQPKWILTGEGGNARLFSGLHSWSSRQESVFTDIAGLLERNGKEPWHSQQVRRGILYLLSSVWSPVSPRSRDRRHNMAWCPECRPNDGRWLDDRTVGEREEAPHRHGHAHCRRQAAGRALGPDCGCCVLFTVGDLGP